MSEVGDFDFVLLFSVHVIVIVIRLTPELACYWFFQHSCHVPQYKETAVILCNVMYIAVKFKIALHIYFFT